MTEKIELSTLKSKINIFKYLIQADKKWSISVIVMLVVYIILGLSLSAKAIIDRIRFGRLSSITFNIISNSVFMIVILIVLICAVIILAYKSVGKSLTTSDITIEFNDLESKFIIEYKDILGKFNLGDADDKVITNTIFYRDITNIGVLAKYNMINIQGFIRILRTDSITSNEISYSSSRNRSSSDNITLFLTDEEFNYITERISRYYNIQYMEIKPWYQKEEKSEN